MELSKSKKIIVGLVVLVLCFVGYKVFLSPADVAVPSEYSDASGNLVGQDVLDLLQSLQNVSIDPALFSGYAFQNLEDFSITVQAEPLGRTNPFAPIGQ